MKNWYQGKATPSECEYEVTVNGEELNPRLDLHNHSPTGLSWGYGGSGPAQCALAILAHEVGDDLALKHYQRFKQTVIATLPNTWAISSYWIRAWLKKEQKK